MWNQILRKKNMNIEKKLFVGENSGRWEWEKDRVGGRI
jgi:hypothetical protein